MEDFKAIKEDPWFPKQGGFREPLVRCTECNALLEMKKITKVGRCYFCSNRKVRRVLNITDEEREKFKEEYSDFMKLFEPWEE